MSFPIEDTFMLGGITCPGVIREIRGLSSPRQWDKQPGYGVSEGIKFTSVKLCDFEIEIQLWDEAQYEEWELFAKLRLTEPVANLRPTSMSIRHPMVNAPPHMITQVVIADVIAPVQDDEGLWTAIIKFTKYKPVRPVASPRPLEGPPGSPEASRPPDDPMLAIIQRNSETIARLAGP